MFAFLRNFSTTKFYSAAQSGVLTGTAPFTFGSLFSIQTVMDADSEVGGDPQTIFGNAVFGTSGFGHRQLAPAQSASGQPGCIEAAQGTVRQIFGTAEATADATYALNPEGDLINYFRANANGQAIGGTTSSAEAATPKPNQVVFMITKIDGTTQDTYINGQLTCSIARNTTTNANPVRIGLTAAGADAATNIDFAGCFYHSAALTELEIVLMTQAAMMAEDVVNPLSLDSGAVNPDHIWSVKRGNPDGRASWVSTGAAAEAITMARTGTFAAQDLYAANRPWYSSGA